MQHPKGILIERAKRLGYGKPVFDTHNIGLEHEPTFESTVSLRGVIYGEGEGSTKRDAERRASEEALEALSKAADPESDPEERFSGPWPIFPEVLAASLNVAHARVNPTLTGESATQEVQALALELYKGVLENLGEIAELDEDPEEATL